MQYDHFSVYGFEVQYPSDWRVEFHPKSEKTTGEVSFLSPEGDRTFVFWGVLEEAKNAFTSLDEHVDRTIKKVKKSRGVKSAELVERKELEINGHRAIFTLLKAIIVRRVFLTRRVTSQNLWSSHLYCEKTARYFILHGSPSSEETTKEHAEVFEHMQKSFRCHTK